MGQLQSHRLGTVCGVCVCVCGWGHLLSGCGTGWRRWAEARSRTGHRSSMSQVTGSPRKGWTLGCYFHSCLCLCRLGRRNPRAFPREQPFYFESPSPVPTKKKSYRMQLQKKEPIPAPGPGQEGLYRAVLVRGSSSSTGTMQAGRGWLALYR